MEEVYMTFPQSLCLDHTPQFQQLVYALLKLFKRLRMLPAIPGEDIPLLSRLALYHDIGKTALPDAIIYKTGKFTEAEFELMKEHTVLGAKMVAVLPELQGEKEQRYAHEICLYHHERWDGGGYPEGLRGKDIPGYVHIISLADVYDALLAPRVYRDGYSHKEAVKLILSKECGAFSSGALRVFRRYIDEIHSQVYSD